MESEKESLSKQKTFVFCTYIISIFGIFCSSAVLFPSVQRQIIQLAEQYLIHRKVNFYDDWMNTLFSWAKGCIFLIIVFDFFILTNSGRKLFKETREEIKNRLSEIDFRIFLKPFLFMLIVYFLGLISLIRSNFLYIDDVDRAVRGYHGWNGWSRHLSDILSTFVHADTNLADISPLTQFLAVLIMAAGSVLLVYILCGKITYKTLLASIPLGLSPYFLENFSYKFDSPYLGLSVLVSIIPFLFTETKKAFVFSSIASLLVMCMTYQASSGIYVLIVIMILFNDWNKKRKRSTELLSFGGTAAVSYCTALVIFRVVFMVNGTTGHGVSTSILPFNRFFPGTLTNLKTYISLIYSDFGVAWKIGIAVIILLFIVNAVKRSLHLGILRLFVPACVLILSLAFSFGAYIFLENPLFLPRAFIGFGAFIAITSICLVSYGAKKSLIPVIALNWCFLAFAFSYGNALYDQNRYTDFRVEILLHDLNILFPDRNSSDPEVRLENYIGFGPFTENIARHYPLIKKLVPSNRYYQFYKYMSKYFHWPEGEPWNENISELPVVFNSYYHTIKSDGKYITVILKNY